MKIIYIAGDGRSGSTLLDSILANLENSISVGECHRFWGRFYETDTLCGCSDKIEDCQLWRTIDEKIKNNFPNYNPKIMRKQVMEIQYFSNFQKIPKLISTPSWKTFGEIVKFYYSEIAKTSNSEIIVDSSKSISWAYLLQSLDFCDLRIIHLERDLTSVANSWKKTVNLPEYYDKVVLMPKKSNFLITKSWFKIKFLAKKLKTSTHYLFVEYKNLCKRPKEILSEIEKFIEEDLNYENLQNKKNHAIGGNPMRSELSGNIVIKKDRKATEKLTFLEKKTYEILNAIAKFI